MIAEIVLFDLGDVVAEWNPVPRLTGYAARAGLTASQARQRLSARDFWKNTDRGHFSADEMHQGICKLLGCEFTRAELLEFEGTTLAVRPEIVSIAEGVSRHSPVGILTNNAPMLREALPVYFPQLAGLFRPILFSFEFGHVKPELALFEAVQSHLGIPPGGVVFIDDKESHVQAACSLGWDAFRYSSPAQLSAGLASRGLLPSAA